ncbi:MULTISPECIES: radical SAM protein [unclassified Tolypothrix]|nr:MULTISPECIES: radical SAM protein [unclassified Tolypothrix]UYD25276.1 radical SAM protein [Tolypothrix sp. PCC 7712]UYD32484.1 radical SAM protein [Tolypothrix sp. PCC 7601]
MNKVYLAQIEPTTKCNFKCGFCCGRYMDQSNLSLENFAKFLEMFPEIQHLELQGEGEPLMNTEFFDMVELANSQGIHISLITNGSFFSHSNIQRILDAGIRSIRVSLETTIPEKFQKIRSGSIAVIEAGISRLLSERSRLGLDKPSVGFALTVLASTLDDMPSVFDMYSRLGMDGGIAIQLLNRMPHYANIYDGMEAEYLDNSHKEKYQSYMVSDIAQNIWHQKSLHHHFYDELFRPRPIDIEKGKLTSCPWLEQGINMDRHGRITPCCTIKAESWAFGTIENLHREEILQLRADLATELANGKIPTPCQGCGIAKQVVSI